MGLERGNRYMHPLGKRQSVEQTIELVFAVGAVQAEDPGLAGSGAQSPNPDEMPLVHQLGCSGCFRVLTALTSASGVPPGTFTSNSTRNSTACSDQPNVNANASALRSISNKAIDDETMLPIKSYFRC